MIAHRACLTAQFIWAFFYALCLMRFGGQLFMTLRNAHRRGFVVKTFIDTRSARHAPAKAPEA